MLKILGRSYTLHEGVAEQLGEVEYLPGNHKGRLYGIKTPVVRTVTHFDEKILSGATLS